MVPLNSLAAQIRFELDQLSSRNRHHEFEHLCRWLAKKRICSNVIVATGPVSNLGDQGRDFETFRTYLRRSPIAESSFVGSASDGPIAFACTLEKKIGPKIKSDVSTIVASGTPVIDIHYFCATDVPVGRRHKLQEWAREQKNVQLEIHDGQAISEYLTDPDIFWLAEQFLDVPGELYPSAPAEDAQQWYLRLFDYWKGDGHQPENYADFAELKRAIRHSTFADSAKKDLRFWINRMERLITLTPYDGLKRKATYEIFVATLRGLGSLVGYEAHLSTYFDEVAKFGTPADLEDATNLRNYCIGAYYRNDIQVAPQTLRTWSDAVVSTVEAQLQGTSHPGTRCLLLQTRGMLQMVAEPGEQASAAMDLAIQTWLELALIVEEAPLFPLERFADLLVVLLEPPNASSYLENHAGYSQLTQQIDALLVKRHGGFVAAEKCRDRAKAFYDSGELLRAVKEIHKAKIQWFSKETLRGSLLAALFLSTCYEQLGLAFASKYYALATAFIAIQAAEPGVQPLISKALQLAATRDYSIGGYCGFFDVTDAALSSLQAFSKGVDVDDPFSGIQETLYHVSILRTMTKRLAPDLLELVDSRIERWHGLEEYFQDLIPTAEKAWADKDFDGLWLALEEQLFDRPFSDLGKIRSVQFRALGVTWRFKWENTYDLTPLAEEIIAAVQVLLADIADLDWFLLRTTTEVEISVGNKGDVAIQQLPSNDLGRWRLVLNETTIRDRSDELALTVASTLLQHASVLRTEDFEVRIEAAFEGGLSHKLLFGQRYSHMYRSFVDKAKFELSGRSTRDVPAASRPFTTALPQQLPWRGELGPSYSEEAARTALKNRYDRAILPIRHTLKRLLQQDSFRQTVQLLRKTGWLDWHIITATSSLALNYRVNKELGRDANEEIAGRRFLELMSQPEGEQAYDVPVREFTEEQLRMQLSLSMVSTLEGLGFEIHQTTPDFEAISDFLGARYRYWTDDLPHQEFGF